MQKGVCFEEFCGFFYFLGFFYLFIFYEKTFSSAAEESKARYIHMIFMEKNTAEEKMEVRLEKKKKCFQTFGGIPNFGLFKQSLLGRWTESIEVMRGCRFFKAETLVSFKHLNFVLLLKDGHSFKEREEVAIGMQPNLEECSWVVALN